MFVLLFIIMYVSSYTSLFLFLVCFFSPGAVEPSTVGYVISVSWILIIIASGSITAWDLGITGVCAQ